VSGEEEACLRDWVAGLGIGVLAAGDDDPAVGQAISGMIACIPDAFVDIMIQAVAAEAGVDLMPTEEERACLRDWLTGAGSAALTGDDFASNIPFGMFACIPESLVDILVQAMAEDSGIAITPSAEERACLGELLAGIDMAALAEGGDEAMEGAFLLMGLGALGCIPALLGFTQDPEPTLPPVADDHADAISGATTVTVGEALQGALDYPGDVDFFAFEAEAGQSYNIAADVSEVAGSFTINRYNADKEWAGISTTTGGRFIGPIEVRADRSGKYYVAAGGDYDGTGSYTLTITPSGLVESRTDREDTAPFRIGVMESLTGPGETYGTVSNQAKHMAVDEINAAGGINGRMIELVVEDSKCSARDAITAYRKLTDMDGVKIILGTSCSGAMLGAAPLAEADGVVLFSGLATNPDIAEAGDYIFRTAMSDAQLGIDTGNVLWADGIRTLATITEATDYAEGVRRSSVAQFEKLGGQVVGEERYPSDIVDFRSQLTKLFSANPDALHIAAQAEFSGGTIVKQARELGFDGPIYGEVVAIGATALEVAGEAATGLKAITADLDPANQKAQEVLRNFRARYDYVTIPWYLGSAYDDVYITAECLKQTGDDQDADGFRDCLYEITWSGAIGDNFSFDEKGEVVGLSNVVVEVLPVAERTDDNQGYKVLGGAPTQ